MLGARGAHGGVWVRLADHGGVWSQPVHLGGTGRVYGRVHGWVHDRVHGWVHGWVHGRVAVRVGVVAVTVGYRGVHTCLGHTPLPALDRWQCARQCARQ